MLDKISLEKKKKIFRERAAALARQVTTEAMEQQSIQVVEFGLAGEKYAIESLFVREVIPLRDMTPLPCTPPFVLGIINVRGQIISIIDLRDFFDLPRQELPSTSRVIVLRSKDMELGIVTDVVYGARAIPLDQVHGALSTLTGTRETYLRGVAGENIVILDAARLLGDKSIVLNEEVGDK